MTTGQRAGDDPVDIFAPLSLSPLCTQAIVGDWTSSQRQRADRRPMSAMAGRPCSRTGARSRDATLPRSHASAASARPGSSTKIASETASIGKHNRLANQLQYSMVRRTRYVRLPTTFVVQIVRSVRSVCVCVRVCVCVLFTCFKTLSRFIKLFGF